METTPVSVLVLGGFFPGALPLGNESEDRHSLKWLWLLSNTDTNAYVGGGSRFSKLPGSWSQPKSLDSLLGSAVGVK